MEMFWFAIDLPGFINVSLNNEKRLILLMTQAVHYEVRTESLTF